MISSVFLLFGSVVKTGSYNPGRMSRVARVQ